jgi:hypothetical protein
MWDWIKKLFNNNNQNTMGKYYKWIKGDAIGTCVEYIHSYEEDTIKYNYFSNDMRLNSELTDEFLTPINEEFYYEWVNSRKQTSQIGNPHVENIVVQPIQQAVTNPIFSMLDLSKKHNIQIGLDLKLKMPDLGALKFITDNFNCDENTINDWIDTELKKQITSIIQQIQHEYNADNYNKL